MSELENNPYLSKLDVVASAKDAKLGSLNEAPELAYEQVTLESMRDGDSPTFVGVEGGLGATAKDGTVYDRTGKLSADRVAGDLDTYEVFPDNPESLTYNTENPHGIRKMYLQRARLAGERGVPVDQITNEDVYEEGAKGTYKSLALLQAYEKGDEDYIQQVRDWNPDPEMTKQWRTSAPKFGSREKPLNIKVDRHFTGEYGYYGRPLSVIKPTGSKYLIGVEGGGYSYGEKGNEGSFRPAISSSKELAHAIRTAQASRMDKVDQTFNGVKGFAATFISELLINPIDFVGDQTGLFDLGNEEAKTKRTNNFFGYNPVLAEQAMEKISDEWDIVSDSSVSTADRVKAAGRGIVEALVTPEMLGTSLGALVAWAGPGKFLKLLGYGSKYGNTAASISARVKAGEITAQAGRAEKIKALSSIDGIKALLTNQAGMITSAMGNVNNQYEQFVANNGGKELEGLDKAEYFASRFGVQIVNQNIDKLIDLKVLRAPGVLTSIIPAAKAMTNKEFSNLAKTLAKGVGVTTGSMGLEATQEYAQTTMELFNARYGSELFKDSDTFIKFLQDERNIDEAGIAAIAGAGGSLQFQAVGSVLPLTGAGLAAANDLRTSRQSPNLEGDSTPVTEDEVTTAKREYGELLSRVRNSVDKGEVTSENILSYVEDIEKINEAKHVLRDSSVESVAKGEEAYNSIIDKLEKFITDNADVKLTKRITRKTVQESIADNRALEALQSLPDESKVVFQATAEALGQGEEYTFEDSIAAVQKFISKGTYDEVVEDEEAMGPFIQGLEQSLTGITSETTEESFGKVQDALAKFSTTQTLPDVDTDQKIPTTETVAPKQGTDTVMGTGPTFTIEEGEYDDFSRTADVTRAISVVLGARGSR
jgi:hypothetical protein